MKLEVGDIVTSEYWKIKVYHVQEVANGYGVHYKLITADGTLGSLKKDGYLSITNFKDGTFKIIKKRKIPSNEIEILDALKQNEVNSYE